MTHVSVIGLGYMGLPMAAILASKGHKVTGVDINPSVIARINKGECPFLEPGMPELVREAHASGNLTAVEKPVPAEIFILSLPTPVDHITHEPDMSAVESGARSIAAVLKDGDLVILESTSPVGATHKNVQDVIETIRPDLKGKIDYVFCPERAIPGATLKEMIGNDRLVGGFTPSATKRGLELYKSFCTGELMACTAEEAEMVKLVENASRDAQIAFANELSQVCNKLGLDVWNVIRLANHHPRVNILMPGPGVGGHCIAVDPWFIINADPEHTPFMRTVREVNDNKPYWTVGKVKEAIAKKGKSKAVVACLGLAYKPNVEDLRESPSIVITKEISKLPNADVRIVEPFLEKWEMPLTDFESALKEADVVVTLTAHDVFKKVDTAQLAGKMVVDVCGIYRGKTGFTNFV